MARWDFEWGTVFKHTHTWVNTCTFPTIQLYNRTTLPSLNTPSLHSLLSPLTWKWSSVSQGSHQPGRQTPHWSPPGTERRRPPEWPGDHSAWRCPLLGWRRSRVQRWSCWAWRCRWHRCHPCWPSPPHSCALTRWKCCPCPADQRRTPPGETHVAFSSQFHCFSFLSCIFARTYFV